MSIGLPDDDDMLGVVVLVVVSLVIIAIGIYLASTVAALFATSGSTFTPATGDTVTIDDRAEVVELYDSTGNALYIGVDGGHVAIPTDGGAGENVSTAVVWARLDDDAAQWDEYHVGNFGNGSASIQYRGGEWYAYYNQTEGGVAEVTAPAPTPTDRTMVGYRANETHLAIVVEGSIQNATAFAPGSASVPNARQWWGDLDELRMWGAGLSSQQFGDLESDPIGPMEQGNVTARLMLDEGSGAETRVLPSNTWANLNGDTTWIGDGLTPRQFEVGTDYEYDPATGTISIVDGSRLDALRMVYVEYMSKFQSWINLAQTVFGIMVLLPLLATLGLALWLLMETRGR